MPNAVRYVVTGEKIVASFMDVFNVDVVLKMFAPQGVTDRVGER